MQPVLPTEGTMYLTMRDGTRIDTTNLRDNLKVSHETRARKKHLHLRETCMDCGLDSTRPWMFTAMDVPKEDLERKYTKDDCPECTRDAAVGKYRAEMEQRQKEAEAMKGVVQQIQASAPSDPSEGPMEIKEKQPRRQWEYLTAELTDEYEGPGLASMVTTAEFLNGQATKAKRASTFRASARVARKGTGRLRMTK